MDNNLEVPNEESRSDSSPLMKQSPNLRSSQDFILGQIVEVDEKIGAKNSQQNESEQHASTLGDPSTTDDNRPNSFIDVSIGDELGSNRSSKNELSMSMTDYYNRKRSQTDNPTKLATMNTLNRSILTKHGRKESNPSVELKLS